MVVRQLRLGGGPLHLGLAPALTALVYVVFTLLAGRRSDRSGRGLLCVGGSLLLVPAASVESGQVAILADPTGAVFAVQQR